MMRQPRDLQAARAMNGERHVRRDLRRGWLFECPDCWSNNGRQPSSETQTASRCSPCKAYRGGEIEAERWADIVLRRKDCPLFRDIVSKFDVSIVKGI